MGNISELMSRILANAKVNRQELSHLTGESEVLLTSMYLGDIKEPSREQVSRWAAVLGMDISTLTGGLME